MVKTSKTGRLGQLAVVGLVWVLAGLVSPTRGDEPTKHVFSLDYARSGFSLNLPVELDNEKMVFEKEPDFGGRAIVRGTVRAGEDGKALIGFAWDRVQAKLYVDLNRNLDLTDDVGGAFNSRDKSVFQTFSDIPIELELGGVKLPYLLEVSFYSYQPSRPRPSARVRSGFSGEIELYGKKWCLGIADGMDGNISHEDRLVLRPYGDQSLTSWELAYPLNVAENVCLDGRSYALSFSFEQQKTKPVLQVTFAEQQLPMGRLDIQGKFIVRMVLADGQAVIVMDRPKGEVDVPVGEYRGRDLVLDDGAGKMLRAERFAAMNDDIRIRQGQSTPLKIGGPLNNSVNVQRAGNILRLNYRLVGVGGLDYQPLAGRPDSAPSFGIFQGERKIASGTFEYG